MKALVLGFGISGKSASTLLMRKGYSVECCDDNSLPKHYTSLKGFDLFVPSPGIPQNHPLYQMAIEEQIPISGEVELFLQTCSNRCIGVTGTNGKTTTTLMIAHVLNNSGIKAVAAGNIGIPLSEVDRSAVCVLELSSFQLETLKTPKLEVGVILNVTEDHFDRYSCFEDYLKEKLSIVKCIKDEGTLFVHRSIPTSSLAYPFKFFDGGNLEAVKLVCQKFGVEDTFYLQSFKYPSHRLEHIATVNGVTYINDSKATNIEATLYALKQVQKPCILIMGGRDKGLSFQSLNEAINKDIQVIIYGEAREKIANTIQAKALVYVVETLERAVVKAKTLASKGTTILLSPACASFDAFCSYKERGEAFKYYVHRSEP